MKDGAKPRLILPGGRVLDFSGPALIMAIVNCNDDSFYTRSRALQEKAVEKALLAEQEGASIVDFGAESTRPGSSYIAAEEELRRVIPVIASFRKQSALPVSIDTRKAVVARAALDAGADIVNDVSALESDGEMALVCAEKKAAVVLMHKKGDPSIMQDDPRYEDVVGEVGNYLREASNRAISAGIEAAKIILDPGFGFAKNTAHNLELLRGLKRLAEICGKDYPLLVGLSRKSFIGEVTGRGVNERLSASLAANGAAIMNGADIIRVHDVKEHRDLVKMLYALGAE